MPACGRRVSVDPGRQGKIDRLVYGFADDVHGRTVRPLLISAFG